MRGLKCCTFTKSGGWWKRPPAPRLRPPVRSVWHTREWRRLELWCFSSEKENCSWIKKIPSLVLLQVGSRHQVVCCQAALKNIEVNEGSEQSESFQKKLPGLTQQRAEVCRLKLGTLRPVFNSQTSAQHRNQPFCFKQGWFTLIVFVCFHETEKKTFSYF